MQRSEISGAVGPLYGSLGVRGLRDCGGVPRCLFIHVEHCVPL